MRAHHAAITSGFLALACTARSDVRFVEPPSEEADAGASGASPDAAVGGARRDAALLPPVIPPGYGYCNQFEKRDGLRVLGDAGAWARSFGGWSEIGDLALDAAGDLVVAGTTLEPFDIAGHGIEPPVGVHGYLGKLSHDGSYLWSQLLTTSGIGRSPRVAALPRGGTVAALGFEGRLGLGDRTYDAASAVAVASFDSEGKPGWVQILPNGLDSRPRLDVAADLEGNVYVAGTFGLNAALAGPDGGGTSGTLVVKLSPEGDLVWYRRFGSLPSARLLGIAVDGNGDVVVGGAFSDTLTVEDVTLQARGFGNAMTFVAKLESSGNLVWARVVDGQYDTSTLRLDVGPGAEIALAGGFTGSLGVPGDLHRSAGTDAFALRMTADGTVTWRTSFGAPYLDEAYAVAWSAAGDVSVGGVVWGDVPVGSVTLHTSTIRNAFLTTFDAVSLGLRAGTVYPSSGVSYVSGLAYGPNGELVVAGTFDCALDVPLGTLSGEGNAGFVMLLPP